MVWRDRFWVQQGEERKKIDTLLHRPRGKETQPWLVIVFLLYFDGRTVNGLIRRLLSKNAICQEKKREKKFFFGGGFAAPKKERKSWLFPRGCIIHWPSPFFAFLSAFFVFSLCVSLFFFPYVHMWGKLGAMWDKGGLERRQLLGCAKLSIWTEIKSHQVFKD